MTNNLPSGYFSDMQLVKEVFLPAFQELEKSIEEKYRDVLKELV